MQHATNDAGISTASSSGQSSGKRLARLFAFRLNRGTKGLEDESDQDFSPVPTISCESVDDECRVSMPVSAKSMPASPSHYYCSSSDSSSPASECSTAASRQRNFVFASQGRPNSGSFLTVPSPPASLNLGTGGGGSSSSYDRKMGDVSPQIVRRTQWKMLHWRNKTCDAAANQNAPSSSSALLNLVGQMPKLRQKMKMKSRQTSMAETSLWKPSSQSDSNIVWVSSEGLEVHLIDKRLENLSEAERTWLQKLALVQLQKLGLGVNITKPKEQIQTCTANKQQSRYSRSMSSRSHTVNVVEKESTSRQIFGVPLSQSLKYEQLIESLESSQTQGDGVNVKLAPSTPFDYNRYKSNSSSNGSPGNILLRSSALNLHTANSSSQGTIDDDDQGNGEHRCQSLDLSDIGIEEQTVKALLYKKMQEQSANLPGKTNFFVQTQDSSDSWPSYHQNITSVSSKCSLETQDSLDISTNKYQRRYASTDQLNEHSYHNMRHPLGNFSTSNKCLFREGNHVRVPKFVDFCTKYLRENGLQTVGLFRVAGSAKRCRQMRLDLDSGRGEHILQQISPVSASIIEGTTQPPSFDLQTSPDNNGAGILPHDVATLLKEYFRDLPEPLLTKELYQAFVAVSRLDVDNMLIGIRNLTSLLPTANRDTLLILLQFLHQVSQHSADTVDQQGVLKSGNKMNTHNLATIFGPNILRPSASNKRVNEQLSNNENAVKVVQFMIENCDEIYTVPKETLNSLYKLMQETEAEVVDRLLSSLYASSINPATLNPSSNNNSRSTITVSCEVENSEPSVTTEPDGTTLIKTKTTTTHRIVYNAPKQFLTARSAENDAANVTDEIHRNLYLYDQSV